MDDLIHHREVVLAHEWAASDGHLVEHDAERPEIAAAIDRLSPALLGGHVRDLALERTDLRLLRATRRARDTEVDQLDRTFVADEHVARRHIAVNDAEVLSVGARAGVRVIERGGDAVDDRECDRERHRLLALASEALDRADVLAMDELHREERRACVLVDLVHVSDVRMLERRGEARFVEEHPDEIRIVRDGRQDALDDAQLLEAGRSTNTREIDLGHSAHRELPQDLVLAEHRARREVELHGRCSVGGHGQRVREPRTH